MVMRLQRRIRWSAWLIVSTWLLGDAEIFAQRNRPYIPPPPVVRSPSGGGVTRSPVGMPSRPRPTQPTRPGPSSTRPTTGSPSGGRPGQPSYTGSTTRAVPRRTTPVTTASSVRRPPAANASNVVPFRSPIPAKGSARVLAAQASARARLAQAKASLRTRLQARRGNGGRRPPGGGGGGGDDYEDYEDPPRPTGSIKNAFNRAASSGARPAAPPGIHTNSSIRKKMRNRSWTLAQIEEAIARGRWFRQKKGGVRYEHPQSKKSVVIDPETGRVYHVGEPGQSYTEWDED
jgi:hypothetical protein